MGLGMGENGDTYTAFLIWVMLRIVLQETIIVHENSELFPLSVMSFPHNSWYGLFRFLPHGIHIVICVSADKLATSS